MSLHREMYHLGRLAVPVILGQLGMVVMGSVDLVMVGSLGDLSIAAVGIGNLWSFGVLIVALGTLRGLDPVFSQAHGAQDDRAIGATFGRALLLALVLTVPMDLLHRAAAPGLLLLSQPADAIGLAAGYVDALRWSIAPFLLFNVVSLFLQNLGRTLLPTLVVIAMNFVNAGLNALLIHVLDWGVVGCGWSTTACRVLSLLLLLALSWPLIRSYPRPPLSALCATGPLARLLRLGGPVGIQYGIEVWAFNAAGVMVGWLGTTAIAAHQIALNITSLMFMVPFGLGIAASARVGHQLGAGRPWTPAGWIAIGTGGLWMTGCATVLWTAAPGLARLYTPDHAVLAVTGALLPIAATFLIFDGIQAVTAGVLRGAGDTRSPALINLLGFWLIGLPVGYVLGVVGQDPGGVWYGLVAGLTVVAILLLLRLRSVSRINGFRQDGF